MIVLKNNLNCTFFSVIYDLLSSNEYSRTQLLLGYTDHRDNFSLSVTRHKIPESNLNSQIHGLLYKASVVGLYIIGLYVTVCYIQGGSFVFFIAGSLLTYKISSNIVDQLIVWNKTIYAYIKSQR